MLIKNASRKKSKSERNVKSNPTYEQSEALKDLQICNEIILTIVNKDVAVFIQDVKEYMAEKIPSNQTQNHA